MKFISPKKSKLIVSLLLASLVLGVYWQVAGFDFSGMDNSLYVTDNAQVGRGISLDGIWWAFTDISTGSWHPLAWFSHMADVELFGMKAGWHHLASAFWHLASAILLFLVLESMTGALWTSALVAAAFALHPLHVESVAWIAERKDLLSAFFWILTMAAYLHYVRRPAASRFLMVAGSFVAGLMAKPMLVTLPFVLLLLDYWPLGRWREVGTAPESGGGKGSWRRMLQLTWGKVPLIAISVAFSVLALVAQRKSGAVPTVGELPLRVRIPHALTGYLWYIGKTLWPSKLTAYYPYPDLVPPVWRILAAVLVLMGFSALVFRLGRNFPYLPVGWLWFMGTMVPVIGFVQIGSQLVADRYSYIPLIGLFIAIAWTGREAAVRFPPARKVVMPAAFISVGAMLAAAHVQTGYWRDNITLFERAARINQNNWFALGNLGAAYLRAGRNEEAVEALLKAVRTAPDYVEAYNNLGLSYDGLGRTREAIENYRKAVFGKPDYAEAYGNMGVAYGRAGRYFEAEEALRQAIRLRPLDARAHYNLGLVFLAIGDRASAMKEHAILSELNGARAAALMSQMGR